MAKKKSAKLMKKSVNSFGVVYIDHPHRRCRIVNARLDALQAVEGEGRQLADERRAKGIDRECAQQQQQGNKRRQAAEQP